MTAKQDFNSLYASERIKYESLMSKETPITTTGNLSFTSISSGQTYNSITGETGLLTVLKTALNNYIIGASDWNDTVDKIAILNGNITDISNDYVRSPAYGQATGSVNAYTFSTMVATTLVDGMSVYLDNVVGANTGASTFNWSGLGAKSIVDGNGNPITAGKMPLNCIIGLRYNASSSSFQLLGEGVDATSLITATNLILGM